jgi:subtilisin family serine protease
VPTRIVAIAALLVGLSAAGAPSPAAAAQGGVLVRFKPGVDAAGKSTARRDAGVRREAALPVRGLEAVQPTAGTSTGAAISALEADPAVLYAERDRSRTAARVADDPLLPAQWGLERVRAADAWDVTTGSPDVLVAVVDTGVDASHPDLSPNLMPGWDFVDNDGTPDDESAGGHGTHVAGILGARGDDGIGVSGLAWTLRLMPLRFLDASGSGTIAAEVQAFAYAAAAGARIVNASFGGAGYSKAEHDAIASAPDTLFVAAAGNDGADDDADPHYPCAYDLPNLICVTASDRADGRPASANFGAHSVDLAAPGEDIESTVPGGGWAAMSGTSMAAPYVSGAAALLLARQPAARPADLVTALTSSVDPLPAFSSATVSGGRLDVPGALRTLRVAAASESTVASPVPASPSSAVANPVVDAPVVPAEPATTTRAVARRPAPAKLKVRRAAVRRGRLDVLVEITRRAAGSVDVTYRSGGRTLRFAAPIHSGRIRFARSLRSGMSHRTGILTVRWRGTEAVRPASVRVRAAAQGARLHTSSAAIRTGRLTVRGAISPRARGVVRLRLEYVESGNVESGNVASRRFNARIRRGRWRLAAPMPVAAAQDAYLTVQFTGYLSARGGPMRGEQDGRQVAGG